MTTPRGNHKPLPKIRTFAQDLEDERAERAHGEKNVPSPSIVGAVPVATPIQTAAVKKIPTPSDTHHAASVENKSVPIVTPEIVKKVSPPPAVQKNVTPPPVAANVAPSTVLSPTKPVIQTVAKTAPIPKMVVTGKPSVAEVRDTHYEATIITDNKHKRFRLGREIIKSVEAWWKEKQKTRAPKYTVPQADIRKGVIQQATSKTGRGAAGDHSAVLARIRENNQNGKAALASQIQIKRSAIETPTAVSLPPQPIILETTTTVTSPRAMATSVAETPIVNNTASNVTPTPESIPHVATNSAIAPIIPTAAIEPVVVTAEPTIPVVIAPQTEQWENQTDDPQAEFSKRRGVDVYVPYQSTYENNTAAVPLSMPTPVSVPTPYEPPTPLPVITNITPRIPEQSLPHSNRVTAITNQEQETRDKFGYRAREFVVDEKQEIVGWLKRNVAAAITIVNSLSPQSLLRNPNHLVFVVLLFSTIAFVGYIYSQTVKTDTVAATTNTTTAPSLDGIPQETVSLVATNKSALFGSIASKIEGGESAKEIVFVDSSKTPVSTVAFATIFYNSLDPNFIASIKSVRFGVYRGSPWILLTVDNTVVAQGGMLAWEPTMSRDLDPLFGPTIGNPGRPQASAFTDTTIDTVDTRVLADSNGEPKIIYGFSDRTTILITQSPFAFSNLLKKR
jgi:hypothetical protein